MGGKDTIRYRDLLNLVLDIEVYIDGWRIRIEKVWKMEGQVWEKKGVLEKQEGF